MIYYNLSIEILILHNIFKTHMYNSVIKREINNEYNKKHLFGIKCMLNIIRFNIITKTLYFMIRYTIYIAKRFNNNCVFIW